MLWIYLTAIIFILSIIIFIRPVRKSWAQKIFKIRRSFLKNNKGYTVILGIMTVISFVIAIRSCFITPIVEIDAKKFYKDLQNYSDSLSPKAITLSPSGSEIPLIPDVAKEKAKTLKPQLKELEKSEVDLPFSKELADGLLDIGIGNIEEGEKKILNNLSLLENEWKKAEQLKDQAIKKADELKNSVFISYKSLGDAGYYKLRFKEASEWYKKALNLEPENIGILNSLGACFLWLGQYVDADNYFNKALRVKDQLGNNYSEINAILWNNIGVVLCFQSDYKGAIDTLKKVVGTFEKINDIENPIVAVLYGNISSTLYFNAEFKEAIKYNNKELELNKRLFGEKHPQYANSLNTKGLLLLDYYRNDTLALKYFNEALKIYKDSLGSDHPFVAIVYNSKASVLHAKGDYEGAISLYKKALEILIIFHKTENQPSIATLYNNIAKAYYDKGNLAKALHYIKIAYRIQLKILGIDHANTITTRVGLQKCGGNPEKIEREVLGEK